MTHPGKKKQHADEQAQYQRLVAVHVQSTHWSGTSSPPLLWAGSSPCWGRRCSTRSCPGDGPGRASAPTLATIFISAVLTGLSIYHHVGEFAGRRAVPI